MSSREDILQSIRRATHVKYEKPDLEAIGRACIDLS